MAMIPLVAAGAGAAAVTYQVYNPPEKQAPEGKDALPRNLQDWRLTPQDAKMRIPDYWRNHVSPATDPVEDSYRSTYNNIYTNAPKIMQDSITGNIRIIVPDGNSTNDTIVDHPGFGQEAVRPRRALRSARNDKQYTMPTK